MAGAAANALLDQLAEALAAHNKSKGGVAIPEGWGGPKYRATPSTPSSPYYEGPGGLFGVPGLERDVISARIQPFGLADKLPVVPTNTITPLFPYLTGFTGDTGVEPNGVCDDAPEPGPGKSCIQSAQFGRFTRQTRTMEVNRLGAVINRGEYQDLSFMNDPIGLSMGGITMPEGIPAGNANLQSETLMRMLEVGVSFQLLLSRFIFEGNPANNSAGGGYREFPGLDILIGTTKVDAITQESCPALASDIKNANYLRVDLNGAQYVNILSYMMRYIRYNNDHMGFGQTVWAFVMRPAAFWELTSVWPCAYMTYRCQTAAGNEGFVDSADMVALRDDMRNNSYLLVDGQKYTVIQDSNIREHTNTTDSKVQSGAFSSDVYIVPLTVRGGIPVTYWQFFDFRTSLDILGDGPLANQYFWSDGGRYLWHFKPPANFCVQWIGKVEPRIILRTPQLAGRLQNVMYMPLQHERDVRPTDPYFVNGGHQGARTQQALYGDWGAMNTSAP